MPPIRPEFTVASSPDQLYTDLRDYLQEIVDESFKHPGFFAMGVSGGSMPKVLAVVLPQLQRIDWRRVKLFMVDERMVPHHSSDSNYGAYLAALPKELHPCLIPVEMHEIPYRQDKNAFPFDVGRTALQYEQTVKLACGPEVIGRVPRFDVILLGIGPDGHTASIFPNGRLWKVRGMDTHSWVMGVEDSPKPPPRRVTITLPVINAAKHVAFIATGEDKAPAIKSIHDRDLSVPAANVRPQYGTLRFFLDSAAASKL